MKYIIKEAGIPPINVAHTLREKIKFIIKERIKKIKIIVRKKIQNTEVFILVDNSLFC
jgi:hypothetical protein